MTIWIVVAVVGVLLLVIAGVLVARRRRKQGPLQESGTMFSNYAFDSGTKINPVRSNSGSEADPGRASSRGSGDGGYLDVGASPEGTDAFGFQDGVTEAASSGKGTGAAHSAKQLARRSSTDGSDAELLPKAWRSLSVGNFKKEEQFPKVLLSYQSHSTGHNVGKTWMWAVANGFRKAKITSFNGYQVIGGENWQMAWFGVLPECKMVVVMLSKSYFTSKACIHELVEACSQRKPMIPIYLEDVDISGYFLGSSPEQKMQANFIRPFISRNCVPPPDKGRFQGNGAADFKRNMKTLVETVKTFLK